MPSFRFTRLGIALLGVLSLGLLTAAVRSQDSDREEPSSRDVQVIVEESRNDNPPFYVRVKVDHPDGVYKVGEEIKVTVRSEKAGYLYLFYVNVKGKVRCLFPNKAQTDNRIEGKQDITYPSPDAKFKFRVSPPTGKEILQAVVTLDPPKSLDVDDLTREDVPAALTTGQFKDIMLEVTTGGSSSGGSIQQNRQKLKEKPREYQAKAKRWAEHHISIRTVDAEGGPEQGATQGKSKRAGVFVGISQYQSPQIRKLRCSHLDAIKLAEAMKRAGALTEEPVVLTNDKATLRNIETAIKELAARTRPGDMAVIYWSGHGGRCAATGRGDREPDGFDEYLVPYDGRLDDIDTIRTTMLMDDTFGRWIQALDGRKVVVILDACHSGGQAAVAAKDLENFAKGIEGPGSKEGEGKDKEFFLSTELDRLTKDIGQKEAAVLASSRASQVSFERREQDMSVMTYYLVEQLNKADGPITLTDFAANLRKKVPDYVQSQFPGATQTPVFFDQTTPTVYVKPQQ